MFGDFYNMRFDDNRLVIARKGPLPSDSEVQANARQWAPSFWLAFHTHVKDLLPLMDSDPDWPPDTRVISASAPPQALRAGTVKRTYAWYESVLTPLARAIRNHPVTAALLAILLIGMSIAAARPQTVAKEG